MTQDESKRKAAEAALRTGNKHISTRCFNLTDVIHFYTAIYFQANIKTTVVNSFSCFT
jgi:hypothetical protein